MSVPDPVAHVPVMRGGFRVWCWHGCGWWREAPAVSLGRLMLERVAHVVAEHEPDGG